MNVAHVVGGALVAYPYQLRPDAKRTYPHVSPLPGSWEQCGADVMGALNAVEVAATDRPQLALGESVTEGVPTLVNGAWVQTWVVSAADAPMPLQVLAHHLRRALTQFGMRDAVEAHIAALPLSDPMRDDWAHAPYFSRAAVGIEAARVALKLSKAAVDALFVAAAEVRT